MASKNELYRKPQYAARHDDAFDLRGAQLAGEAAAGALSHDDENTTPFIKDAANRAITFSAPGPAVNIKLTYASPYRRTWGEILGL